MARGRPLEYEETSSEVIRVRMTPSQKCALERMAADQSCSISKLIRDAINGYVADYGDQEVFRRTKLAPPS